MSFCSDIQDINEVLEVTVYDENKYRKFDFLGKVQRIWVFDNQNIDLLRS